jgi:hypothetical protein
VQALIAQLTTMRAADPSSKALVFSQYHQYLHPSFGLLSPVCRR